jgi:hypothetical protein
MKPVGMDIHIFNRFRLVQPRQNCLNPVHHIRRELAGIILLKKPFKPPVPETHYHIYSVACRASLVNIIGFNNPFSINPEEQKDKSGLAYGAQVFVFTLGQAAS